MKVTFQSGVGEVLSRFGQRKKSSLGQKLVEIFWILFLVVISGVSSFVGLREHPLAIRLLAFVGMFAFTYGVLWGLEYLVQALTRFMLTQISRKHSRAPMQSVTLLREGVSYERDGKKTLWSWSQLKDLKWEGNFIYFNFEIRQNIYLPLDAFSSREQAESFFQMAQTLWQGAGGTV